MGFWMRAIRPGILTSAIGLSVEERRGHHTRSQSLTRVHRVHREERVRREEEVQFSFALRGRKERKKKPSVFEGLSPRSAGKESHARRRAASRHRGAEEEEEEKRGGIHPALILVKVLW
jgi:hypothetical protein